MNYRQPDSQGHFEQFGGKYIPETLMPAIIELEDLYSSMQHDAQFQSELINLLRSYSGRPTPLYYANRISNELGINITYKIQDSPNGIAEAFSIASGFIIANVLLFIISSF